MYSSFPPDMVLTPTSRWPLRLPGSTCEIVMKRPVPALPLPVATPGRNVAEELTSIIVVTFNNLVFNRLCLESLLINTPAVRYQLIVVDNGSDDGTVEYLRELRHLNPQVSLLLNRQNLGFAAACNQGLSIADGDFLVLLNNDTMVPDGWLDQLTARLENPAIGLVGPVTNRCGNEAQIKTNYETHGEFVRFARKRAGTHSGESLDIRMLTMFCVAMRRAVYEEIGALDERFEIGLFEDEDYCMRIRNAGYHLVCAEDVFVHHFGQASIGKLAATTQYGELFHKNRHRFERKWSLCWQPHHHRADPPYEAQVARVRLIVESTIPHEATVLMVSRGDEDLLTLVGPAVWHFPQGEDGLYAGHHPKNSRDAIRQLEELRSKGGQFLVIPATMFWWLDFYTGFAGHLTGQYECVRNDDDCLVYQLTELKPVETTPGIRFCRKTRGLDRLNRNLVTLIIPVRDRYDQIFACMEMLQKQTLQNHRILLIDDFSTDSRVEMIFDRYVDNYGNVASVFTDRQLGYTAAVNIACKLAPGDVLVLDSSCEISAGWLEKMSAAACSRAMIATVSPLTENHPDPVDGPTAMTGQLSTPERPLETVANGSCLYITRAVLRRVGLFDEARFPDGPAAVEDYCRRAGLNDFVNILDDATSIRSGDSPFSFETATKTRKTGSSFFQAAKERHSNRLERPCLLAIIHSGTGGSRFACDNILLALEDEFRCLLLVTDVNRWTLSEVFDGFLKPVRRYGFSSPWKVDKSIGNERLAVLDDICDSYRVDIVHVHHLLCSGAELLEKFEQRSLPVVFSFHDFYSLCPTAHLIDNRGNYCAGSCTPGAGDCPVSREFFRESIPLLKHNFVHRHRSRIDTALASCRAWTAPSVSTRYLLLNKLSSLREKDFHLIEHGQTLSRQMLAVEPEAGVPARVICMGNLNQSKGSQLVLKLMQLNREQNCRFEFHFMGGRPRDFRPEKSGGIYHGIYTRQTYADLLSKIAPSFALFTSICEETFSYTLSETWAVGIPAFASNLGAFGDRLAKHGGGWLFDPNDPDAFYDGMKRTLDDPDAWKKQVKLIAEIHLPSVAEEAEKMAQIFRQSMALSNQHKP